MSAKAKAQELAKKIEKIKADQEAALKASEAEGISPEDYANNIATFDSLQQQKQKAQDEYRRYSQLEATDDWLGSPATSRVREIPHAPDTNSERREFDPARVTIPASARRHRHLNVFRGTNGDREAYAAGLWYAGALLGHQECARRAADMGLGFQSGPQATLNGLSNQSGGFFVPDVIETRIIEISQEYGIIRRLAEVVPMSSDTLTTPRWSTPMTAYWIGRGSAPTSSDPAWNAVQLIAKDMGAMCKIGRQVSEDSLIDLAEKVTMNIARAFSLAEDNAAFNGDGTSTYGGINGLVTRLAESGNSNCLVTATGHTTVSALTNADFLSVTGKAPNYAGADWRWYCHKQVWAQSMAALQLAGGGNRVESIAAGGQMAYLGYPVEFVNVMSAAPSSGNIAVYFAAMSTGVKLGDRRGRTIQAGYENDDFTKQLTTILGTQRVDINVHTVVDPLGDTNAPAGPILALKLG